MQVVKTEEKGSDVAMATYLVLDAAQGRCQTAVIITNDSDLREPIRVVRVELGLTTGVINPHPARRRSRALTATFFKQIRPSALARSQLPDTLSDAQGRVITRPWGWYGKRKGPPKRALHSRTEAREGIGNKCIRRQAPRVAARSGGEGQPHRPANAHVEVEAGRASTSACRIASDTVEPSAVSSANACSLRSSVLKFTTAMGVSI